MRSEKKSEYNPEFHKMNKSYYKKTRGQACKRNTNSRSLSFFFVVTFFLCRGFFVPWLFYAVAFFVP